jgi:integrase
MPRTSNHKRLTRRLVDSLRATGRDYILYDADVQGFGVRVLPSGRRIYFAQYRIPGGGRRLNSRRITIGEHGTFMPEDARKRARELLASVHQGKDPARERVELRQSPLVEDLALPYLEMVERERKSKTAYEYRRMFGHKKEKDGSLKPNDENLGDILPTIGKLRVKDVNRADVARLKDSKEGRYAANRLVALVSSFFSWCEEQGYREPGTNPAKGLKRHREEGRRRYCRYLSPKEAKRLGKALIKQEKAGANPFAVAAIQFLLFTGFREQEGLSLPWSAVNVKTGAVVLPDAKTSERDRVLNPHALGVLSKLQRVNGNPFFFPGARPGDHLHEIKRVWNAVRKEAKLEDFRLHDLRHSYASAAISEGVSLAVVGELLGHRSAQTTKRYAHLFDDARRGASEKASSALAAMLAGRKTKVRRLRIAS